MQKAIKHKIEKVYKPKKEQAIEEEDDLEYESALNRSLVDSDSDEAELKDNLMEKQNYSFVASDIDDEEEEMKPEKKWNSDGLMNCWLIFSKRIYHFFYFLNLMSDRSILNCFDLSCARWSLLICFL